MIMDGRKEYEFVVQWGVSTNTDDNEGEVVEITDKIPTKDEILKIIPEFIGRITQTPPIYSAIKVNGVRAYELARKGVEVEMKYREIEIFDLELLEILQGDMAKFRVECSKGTYVRTLGKDIALRLGTLGYLKELRRTKNGVFGIEDAKTLEVIENMVYRGTQPQEVLLSVLACLRDIAVIAVTEGDAAKLKQGQSVSPKGYENILGDAVASFEGNLVAIVRIDERKMAPVRVFNL
jgi:tRNA pseudouridine55 synthase